MIEKMKHDLHDVITPNTLTEESRLLALRYQLDAARYAFHAIRKHRFKEMVRRGELPEATAKMMYYKAMINYDGIIANAVSGNSREANNAEMNKGWKD